MKLFRSGKRLPVVPVVLALAALGGAASALLAVCGPFTDISGPFCPFILQIYYLGITSGTSPTTYSPDDPVTRGQAAVFVARSFDQSIKRSSRRAALDQWWTTRPRYADNLGTTPTGPDPSSVQFDGADLWVANNAFATPDGSVSRVRASDGKLLETWTGAVSAYGTLVAMGRVFTTGIATSQLYMIDPAQPPGAVTIVSGNLGSSPTGTAFDGARIWTANSSGSVSIVTPGPTIPWSVTTVSAGFSAPVGALYDGANIWVTDIAAGTLLKLGSSGDILQTVSVGDAPSFPVFDGSNIWVPNRNGNTVTVVRASTGSVLATLSGNGLNQPATAAFDGERVLVTNLEGDSVSLWKAADLSEIGVFSGATGAPLGACSDGVNFWITLRIANKLARF